MRGSYSNPSNATWASNAKRLSETFEKWGIGFEDWVIECGVEPRARNSGYYGSVGAVTVRYRLRGQAVSMTLDTQTTPAKNLSSIAITLEAIRMQERRGLGGLAEAHYLALAAPSSVRDPFEVLGLRPDAGGGLIEAAYKTLAKDVHPDAGGTDEAMTELNDARERALEAAAAS